MAGNIERVKWLPIAPSADDRDASKITNQRGVTVGTLENRYQGQRIEWPAARRS